MPKICVTLRGSGCFSLLSTASVRFTGRLPESRKSQHPIERIMRLATRAISGVHVTRMADVEPDGSRVGALCQWVLPLETRSSHLMTVTIADNTAGGDATFAKANYGLGQSTFFIGALAKPPAIFLRSSSLIALACGFSSDTFFVFFIFPPLNSHFSFSPEA